MRCSFLWVATVLFPLLLGFLGCRPAESEPEKGPEPEARVIRLEELGDAVEAVVPDIGSEPVPKWLEDAGIATLPRPGALKNVAMFLGKDGRESRAAFLAPPGTVYSFRVEVPTRAVLRFALGYAVEQERIPQQLTYVITAEEDGVEPSVLFQENVKTEQLGHWMDRQVSLEEWGGREVVLRLSVASEGFTWAAWGAPRVATTEGLPPQEDFDVILVSLDTLRADHLGCYGYSRSTSPHLDSLAERGVRFATAVAQAPWTKPSHKSMFSGVYPLSHEGRYGPPLALVLWQAGYRTGAITGGGQVDYRFGFHQGFETYRVSDWIHQVDEAVEWLDAGRGRSNFLFLHTYEVHDPYDHDELAAGLPGGRIEGGFSKKDWERLKTDLAPEEKAYIEALYDGGIAYVDRQMGLLLQKLEAGGWLDRAVIVVISDHGEQFWEHRSWRHGGSVYDHQLLVPFIVYLPPSLKKRFGAVKHDSPWVVENQVRLVDLYPTVLSLLGLPPEHRIHGRSLVPLLEGRALPPEPAFAENTNSKAYEKKALRSATHKLVWNIPKGGDRATERTELYDLLLDPGEQIDISRENPEMVESMRRRIDDMRSATLVARGEEKEPEELDPDLRQRLEALGYVDPEEE